ncbi:uncharacterized protein A4U43_C10F7140 [Asparagus officinalis]|uniref:Aminotransferase-like plant mobile domain-containing protein n=1 Tax=Asparagus officinalis TaxID=4686 RepID=A0A5P1E5R9_ASPOF|nr:uncharacterized protein A4U43_C10F7140 [Asparagus officinalis]
MNTQNVVEFLSREFSAHSVEGRCSEAYASTDEPIPVPVAPQFAPDYLFGDSIEDPAAVFLGMEQWLHHDDGGHLYLPPIPRHRSLAELRCQAVPREMSWRLTEEYERIHCGYITRGTVGSSNRNRITGLHPGITGLNDPPKGEIFTVANTVKNRLAALGREMPATGHRCYGWVHSSDKLWWTRLSHYILDRFGEDLKAGGLYAAVRATTYGLTMSVPHFLALLELYNHDANTFLTKHGELGLALHEMYKISGLPMGNMIYQEYFPSNKELQQLKSRTPNRYNTFWDLACHYHIALAGIDPLSKKSRPQISLKKFSDYLFKNTDSVLDEPICELSPLTISEVNELIKKSNAQSYTTTGVEDGFAAETKFQTFLWHGVKLIRPTTLLAGYLAIWLKKCVVPYQSSDVLSPEVLFLAVLLAHRKNLCLLPAMTAGIYRGLRQIVSGFSQENSPPTQIPLTKVELPYTYLMAWLVLHRSDMMWAPTSVDPSLPFLQIIENCKWKGRGCEDVRKQL